MILISFVFFFFVTLVISQPLIGVFCVPLHPHLALRVEFLLCRQVGTVGNKNFGADSCIFCSSFLVITKVLFRIGLPALPTSELRIAFACVAFLIRMEAEYQYRLFQADQGRLNIALHEALERQKADQATPTESKISKTPIIEPSEATTQPQQAKSEAE